MEKMGLDSEHRREYILINEDNSKIQIQEVSSSESITNYLPTNCDTG